MSGDKVKFSPLERLDIVDVDALQELVYDYFEEALGGVVGDLGGVLTENAYTYNLTNSTIVPRDFTFIAPSTHAEMTGSVRVRIGKYNTDLAGNSVISFLTTKNSVQSYLDAQGSLPPVPTSATYNASNHGVYYPVVYARTYRVDGESSARRFWSPANNQEVTQNTIVRERQRVAFLTRADGVAPPATTGDSSDWVAIGQLSQWVVNSGSVVYPIMEWRFISDNALLERMSYSSVYANYLDGKSGLEAVSSGLKGMVEVNRNEGASDADVPSAYEVTTDISDKPKYSLDGLAGKIDSLDAREVTINMKATISVEVTSPDGVNLAESTSFGTTFVNGAGVVSNFLTGTASDPSSASSTEIGAGSACADLFSDMSYYYDVEGKTGAPNDSADISDYRRVLFIGLDPSYSGWSISGLSVTPVTSTTNSRYARFALYGGTYDQSRVVSVGYKDEDGNAQTAYGFKIIMTHGETITQRADQLNAELFPHTSGIRSYSFKINLKLTNKNAF